MQLLVGDWHKRSVFHTWIWSLYSIEVLYTWKVKDPPPVFKLNTSLSPGTQVELDQGIRLLEPLWQQGMASHVRLLKLQVLNLFPTARCQITTCNESNLILRCIPIYLESHDTSKGGSTGTRTWFMQCIGGEPRCKELRKSTSVGSEDWEWEVRIKIVPNLAISVHRCL